MDDWTQNVSFTTCFWLVLLGVAITYTGDKYVAKYATFILPCSLICYVLSIVAYFAGVATWTK